MGAPCGLSLLELRAYLDEYGIEDKEERRRVIRFVTALDSTFLAHSYRQMSHKDKTKDADTPKRNRRKQGA